MNSDQLSALVDQRWAVLSQLLEMTDRQMKAIAGERMSELMSLLAEKQQPLSELNEISQQLRGAIGEDPDSRQWNGTAARDRCRQRHRECEQMLARLLELEGESEKSLVTSRESIQEQLVRCEDARRAASGYTRSAASPDAGTQLDLSSD